ncbi:uncharacterized protein LOC125500193 [Athalia rosae]|uniref:uncharacterized protein LOC125500193 n=1 Tax=Athalia rosae TaxID=37344 RepID=UPI002033A357|nr:uncharacterized protein LOC125500193 [Athalia rosae]XP_048507896.1 uncharacterized protein LOC125500193 [Athalia rosae]
MEPPQEVSPATISRLVERATEKAERPENANTRICFMVAGISCVFGRCIDGTRIFKRCCKPFILILDQGDERFNVDSNMDDDDDDEDFEDQDDSELDEGCYAD